MVFEIATFVVSRVVFVLIVVDVVVAIVVDVVVVVVGIANLWLCQ